MDTNDICSFPITNSWSNTRLPDMGDKMTAEWVPVNPCKEHYRCDEYPNFESNKCGACSRTPPIERDKYQAGVDAQKKLLEYQISNVEHDMKLHPMMELFKNWLKSMLKQLEAK